MSDIHWPYLRKLVVATLLACVCLAPWSDAQGQAVSILESSVGESSSNQPSSTAEELPLPPARSEPRSQPESGVRDQSENVDLRRSFDSPVPVRTQPIDRVAIHEAFASVPQAIVSAGPIVPHVPPQLVLERPIGPQRTGTNVAWIDGYWAWHADRSTYYWVSGFWREIPPGRAWVPGQWFAAPGGYQRSNGYWANAQQPAGTVTSRPPSLIDWVPDSVAPGIDSFWVPPKYVWSNDTFALQAGYWTTHQDQFVWQPATYIQTQEGFVFVDGYWDFELDVRGVPYAPLSVPIDIASQTPIVVEPELLLSPNATICIHMFMQPGDSHYYFGNFYVQSDLDRGFLPWYDARAQAYAASTLVSYYQRKFSRQGVSFAAATSGYANRYRSVAATRPTLQPVSIRGRGYAFSDQLSSGSSEFKQLLTADTRVASQRAAIQPRAATVTESTADAIRQDVALSRRNAQAQQNSRSPRSTIPQPDRSLGRSLGRVPPAVLVPPTVVLPRGGVSISVTGAPGFRGGIPPFFAPGIGIGIPFPPRAPSRVGIGIPMPGIAPVGPPVLRRGFRR